MDNEYDDIVTAPSTLERGRELAQEKALATYRDVTQNLRDLDHYGAISKDAEDRALLDVFNAGYRYAAVFAATDENLESLAFHPDEAGEVPTVAQSLSEYIQRTGGSVFNTIVLLIGFIQVEGMAPSLHQYLQLLPQEDARGRTG